MGKVRHSSARVCRARRGYAAQRTALDESLEREAMETDPRVQVLEAARARAAALAAADADALTRLLHEDFRWTSHTGELFERDSYIAANTGTTTRWSSQGLGNPEIL